MLTNGHAKGNNLNGNNYRNLDDENEEDFSTPENMADMISPSRIKMEPICSEDDEEVANDLRNRFNLRKRKVSLTSHSIFGSPNNDLSEELPAMEQDDDSSEKKKRKISKKTVYNYTTEMLQEALDLVRSQNISILNAARQYGIPRSTLRRYALSSWSAKTPSSKSKQEPALTAPEEAHLVSMITKMSRAGKYVSTMDVKSTVQYLLDESQRVVFKDRNRPNAGWVQRFRKRHRNLDIKGSGYTLKKNHVLCKQEVSEWYRDITQYLIEDWRVDPFNFFSDENRHRIFNLDEMNLLLNHKSDLVEELIPRSEEDYSTEITVLLAVSASGDCMQPLIIQKGEGGGHEDDIMPLDQNSYGISFSLAGKMNSDILLRWLEAFDRELCEKGVQKPIVIFLDDVFCHFHISVFSYAIEHDIILICTQWQPHITLQPVEAEIVQRVKDAYRTFSKEFYQMENCAVSLDHFPLTFLRAFETVRDQEGLREVIQLSFTHMGMVPFNPNALVYSGLPALPLSTTDQLLNAVSKSDKFTSKAKEPKARKTLSCAVPNSLVVDDGGLVPKVKILKLNKGVSSPADYKIVDGYSSHSHKESDSLDSSFPSFNANNEPKNIAIDSPRKKIPHPQNPQTTVHQTSIDRLEGRQDGIRKCLDLMQSFVPSDLLPVWSDRKMDEDLKSSSEISYCMWKIVRGLFDDVSMQIDKQEKIAKQKSINGNNSVCKKN